MSDQLKYPIGLYEKPAVISSEHLQQYITDLAKFPKRLRLAVEALPESMMDTPYRSGGWTVRQVVHHCADSHMNNFVRIKLALTEENPTIKPYYEDRWAELPDSLTMPVEPSLAMIEGIHQRWVMLLHSMRPSDFQKGFIHPEKNRLVPLDENTGIYAWHSNHHLAHVQSISKIRTGS